MEVKFLASEDIDQFGMIAERSENPAESYADKEEKKEIHNTLLSLPERCAAEATHLVFI